MFNFFLFSSLMVFCINAGSKCQSFPIFFLTMLLSIYRLKRAIFFIFSSHGLLSKHRLERPTFFSFFSSNGLLNSVLKCHLLFLFSLLMGLSKYRLESFYFFFLIFSSTRLESPYFFPIFSFTRLESSHFFPIFSTNPLESPWIFFLFSPLRDLCSNAVSNVFFLYFFPIANNQNSIKSYCFIQEVMMFFKIVVVVSSTKYFE